MRTILAVLVLSSAQVAFGAGAATPALAMMLSTPGDTASRLVISDAPEQTATVAHPPYAVVKGRMLPGTRTALVVADTWRRERDRSFGAALYRLEPGKAPVMLGESVVHASRPWITSTGRVFVERGDYGPELTAEQMAAGALRTDLLRVDELNPITGEARTVHTFTGYATHLAGALGDELILYRVSFQHADLVAVNVDTGAVRTVLASLPPFARDFSVDTQRQVLVFTDARAGEVIAVELRSGERQVLAVDPNNAAFAPYAWPDGRVAWNDGAGGFVVGGTRVAEINRSQAESLSAGTALVRAASADGRWLAIDLTRPSRLPQPFVVSAELGVVQRIRIAEGVRADVIGLVSAEVSR